MTAPETTDENLKLALRRVVLLRETGPKSAVWHRARVQMIWRLHQLIEQQKLQQSDFKSQESEGRNGSSNSLADTSEV
jgi:hypothetical protein